MASANVLGLQAFEFLLRTELVGLLWGQPTFAVISWLDAPL
jgi:hypothetical protein